jgi:hypothetical protein
MQVPTGVGAGGAAQWGGGGGEGGGINVLRICRRECQGARGLSDEFQTVRETVAEPGLQMPLNVLATSTELTPHAIMQS